MRCVWIALIALSIAACPKSRAPAPAPASTAKTRLTFVTTAEPDSLCAQDSESAPAQELIALLSRELVVDDPTWTTVPDLAAAVPVAKPLPGDRLEVTWRIRDDARWEDGRPVVAADFIKGHALDARADQKRIEKMTASADGRSFTVVWSDTNPLYASTRVHRAVPAHALPDTLTSLHDAPYCRHPLSNGPFKLVEWVPGQHLLFARNDAYTPRAQLDEILVKLAPSTQAALTLLAAGDADAAFPGGGPSPVEAAAFVDAHKDEFVLEKAPGALWGHIDFNLDDPALKDAAVRAALAAAIPRKAIVDAVSHGLYDVTDNYLPAAHWAHAPVDAIPYDPAGAGAVLGPRHLRLTLSSASGQPEAEQLLLLVKDAWRKAGVDVDLDLKPFKVFFGEDARKRKTQLAFYAWTLDKGSFGGNLWRSDRIPSADNRWAGQNFPGWRDADVTAALTQADKTLDLARRKALLETVQRKFRAELPAIPLYFRPVVSLHRKNVAGLRPTGTLTPLAWNASAWTLRR